MILERDQFSPRVRICFWVFVTIITSLVLGYSSAWASEENEAFRECQAASACYWDKNGSNTDPCNDNPSNINVAGSQAAEIVWNGLTSLGFNKEQTAGIMGNMAHESNYLNPVQWEGGGSFNSIDWDEARTNAKTSYGIGLIQFSGGRRVGLLNYINSHYPDLVKYYKEKSVYGPPDYSVNGDKLIELVGLDTYKQLVQANLEYLNLEREGSEQGSYAKFYADSSTPEKAAESYRKFVERNASGTQPERLTSARDYYNASEKWTTPSSGGSSSGTNDTNGANTTIIGDSFTVGISTESNKKEIQGTNLIDGLKDAYVDAKVGRSWSAGVDVLKDIIAKDELQNNVVFALGTNSAELTKAQVEEVINLVGDTRQLYFITNITNQAPDTDKAENTIYANNNTLFNNAATEHSNVKVIDFANKVIGNKAKYWTSGDDIHPNEEGKTIFRTMIIEALNGSSVGSGGICGGVGEGNGDLNSTALALAWPLGTPNNKTGCNGNQACGGTRIKGIANPAYAEALKKIYGENMGYMGQGLACNQFVASVVIYSGVDPNFPTGVTDDQQSYMESHPEKWQALGKSVDTSVLKAGDILVNNVHVKMVVEDNGVLRLAQASYGTETGNIKENIGPTNFYAFRFIGK